MSLLSRRLFSPVWLKNYQSFSQSYLMRTQYYTCLSSLHYVKFQKFDHMRTWDLRCMREFNFNFRTVNSVITKAFDKVFVPQKLKLKHAGFLWYKTLDEVNIEEFFNLLQMPDTYFSWFRIMELHVWMLLFRMNQNGSNLKYVRDGVIEAMWLDMEERARMLDMYNKNFIKNFRTLYEKFKLTLFWYDHGYLEDDTMLASIVWSVFFERECDDPEKLEALVKFIRYQVKHLHSIDTNNFDLTEKTGVWTPLSPHCKGFLI